MNRRRFDLDRLFEPLRDRAVRRLALGKSISLLGDWLMVAALVGWVYERTASTGMVAALMVVRLVPPVLGGGIAAAVADRLPRRRLLVWSELLCAATVAVILVGIELGSIPLVFAAAAACGAISPVGMVAVNAFIPELVPAERLGATNAAVTVGQEVAMAAGALGAGVVLVTGGAGVALAGNLASYAVAAALFAGIRAGGARRDRGRRTSRGIVVGARYVRSEPALLLTVVAFALVTVATGIVNATLPRFLGDLGLGTGAYGFGLAALAAGFMVGEICVGSAGERDDQRWLVAALCAMALLFGALAGVPSAALALAVIFAFGCANGVFEIVVTTLIQALVDADYHGRVFGAVTTATRTTMLGAVALAPLLQQLGSARMAIAFAAGSLGLGAAVATAARGSRQARPQPA